MPFYVSCLFSFKASVRLDWYDLVAHMLWRREIVSRAWSDDPIELLMAQTLLGRNCRNDMVQNGISRCTHRRIQGKPETTGNMLATDGGRIWALTKVCQHRLNLIRIVFNHVLVFVFSCEYVHITSDRKSGPFFDFVINVLSHLLELLLANVDVFWMLIGDRMSAEEPIVHAPSKNVWFDNSRP